MELLILAIFIFGYIAITLEHNLKIDKLVPALVMMALDWGVLALSHLPVFEIVSGGLEEAPLEKVLLHHFGKTCEILIFLIGAMTIVEIIDAFDGFSVIKTYIKTTKKSHLLWIMTGLAFILSAIIDNLTATIVLITIIRKILDDKTTRMWYVGLIIIAANAGGAWSPIGDVTTTMLWIGHKVTAIKLFEHLIIPSLVCFAIPTLIASRMSVFQGNFELPKITSEAKSKYSATMLLLGLLLIIFVPFFKTITHLPPYIGMMLSLGVFTIFAEIFSRREFSITNRESAAHVVSPTHKALSRIEMPSLLFFLGILMTVAALESLGLIFHFGEAVTSTIGIDPFVIFMGFASAVVDNVPLVAASMGMFPDMVIDHPDWHFIAYTAGTGGSMLIIGSAAGVVAMGMERIDFFWYFKNIAWLAFIGYIAGVGTFYVFNNYVFPAIGLA